jgi:hypothetical protein
MPRLLRSSIGGPIQPYKGMFKHDPLRAPGGNNGPGCGPPAARTRTKQAIEYAEAVPGRESQQAHE